MIPSRGSLCRFQGSGRFLGKNGEELVWLWESGDWVYGRSLQGLDQRTAASNSLIVGIVRISLVFICFVGCKHVIRYT